MSLKAPPRWSPPQRDLVRLRRVFAPWAWLTHPLTFGLDRVPPDLEIVRVEYHIDGRIIRVDELDSSAGRTAAAEQKDAQHRLAAGDHVLNVVVTARPRRASLNGSIEALTITVSSSRTFKAAQGALTRLGVVALDPVPGDDIAQRLRLRIDVDSTK